MIRGFQDLGLDAHRPAVTIGNFDGVHRGHQKVMASVRAAADARDCEAVVCTFDPHTQHVLRPATAPPLLQSLDQRLEAMAATGMDVAIVIPFDTELAATGRRHFVDAFLVGELHVGSVHVSQGFFFGHHREGRTAYLERRGAEVGFAVERVEPVLVDGAPVSSTRVRGLIVAGEIEAAAVLLGRPYALVGEVVSGSGRGHDLGAPTANVAVRNGCLPGIGVYVADAVVAGDTHRAVVNVGRRPTFDGGPSIVIEAHLLDFAAELYGLDLEMRLRRRLRDERRFPDAGALAAQIREDVAAARAYFRQAG